MFNRTDKCTKIKYKLQPVIELIIQHARYGQQCCISAVPPLTPRHSKLQVFQQTRRAQNFSKPFKRYHIYHWVFRLIFLSWFIWCPLDISRAVERTTHMTISSTLKFTNTLPYAWKYHRIDSTKLIQERGFDWQHTTVEHLSSIIYNKDLTNCKERFYRKQA